MAYCIGNMSEPESVSTISGEQKYLIPTVIGKINGSNEWCIGDDAVLREKRGEDINANDILKSILTEKSIKINEKSYAGHEVLKAFFLELFKILSTNYHITRPDNLVVTVEYPDRILVNLIRDVLIELEFDKDKIKIIGHSESLIYYTVFQKKEIWVNDVLIFDFTDRKSVV